MHAYAGGNRVPMLAVLASISVVLAIVASALFRSIDFEYDWLVSAPTVAAAFGLLYKLVDLVAWRWAWLHKLGLIDIPVLDGTYTGHLLSKYTGTSIPARLRVEQTWTQLMVRLDLPGTETSGSISVAGSISREGHRDARLVYTYKNAVLPAKADDDMRDHDGTADIVIDPAGQLAGRYFNARGRQGELRLMRGTAESATGD